MKIRKAIKKDLKDISTIHLIETSKKPYRQKWNKDTALKKLEELFKKGEIYILIDKEICGYIAILINLSSSGKSVHIDELWLKEKYQGKGYGKALINFIEGHYKNRGINSLSLISDKNSKAFGFYKKLKFKPYFQGVLMSKKLK